MRKHLTRLGLGLVSLGLMVFFCTLTLGFAALVIGGSILLFYHAKTAVVTALVLGAAYLCGRDMEKRP